MRIARSSLAPALAAIVATVAVTATPALARSRLPRVATELTPKLAIRPAVIGYTGDGSGWIGGFDGHGRNRYGHLRWTQWSGTQATGHGAVWLDDCRPDCAAGRFHPYAVTVDATRPRQGVFRRLTLRYRYHGKRVVDRRAVVHRGSAWYYTIVGP